MMHKLRGKVIVTGKFTKNIELKLNTKHIFVCSSCSLCFQAYEELYLLRQMEKAVVKLLKVKMPGLIRLSSAAVGVFSLVSCRYRA